MTDRRFDTLADMAPVVACHEENVVQLRARVRHLEKLIDTLDSPWWKRLLFRLDGWGPWYRVAPAPAWRPWRRWYRS